MDLIAIDFDKIIFDSIDLVTFFDKATNEVGFMMADVQDGTIENTEEKVYINGKKGVRVGALSRNKASTLAFNNAFMVGGAIATQIGSAPTVASEGNKLVVPTHEIIDVDKGGTTVTLSKTPVGILGNEIPFIYKANKDGTQGEKFSIDATASATKFALDPETKKITLPTGMFADAGGAVIVFYDYETAVGKKWVNNGDKFGKTGKVVVDITARDACDNDTIYHAKAVLNSGSVQGNFTIGVGNEPLAHNVTIEAMATGCGKTGSFWELFIVE